MDIIFYATCALSLPQELPESESWKNYGGSDWSYETSEWQVLVDLDLEFQIPEEASELKSGLNITIPITLEPIGADKSGYQLFEKTTQHIIDLCGGGVVEGPDGFKVV